MRVLNLCKIIDIKYSKFVDENYHGRLKLCDNAVVANHDPSLVHIYYGSWNGRNPVKVIPYTTEATPYCAVLAFHRRSYEYGF